jgi:hypothetical protein
VTDDKNFDFTEPTATRVEKAELPSQLEKAFSIIM